MNRYWNALLGLYERVRDTYRLRQREAEKQQEFFIRHQAPYLHMHYDDPGVKPRLNT